MAKVELKGIGKVYDGGVRAELEDAAGDRQLRDVLDRVLDDPAADNAVTVVCGRSVSRERIPVGIDAATVICLAVDDRRAKDIRLFADEGDAAAARIIRCVRRDAIRDEAVRDKRRTV